MFDSQQTARDFISCANSLSRLQWVIKYKSLRTSTIVMIKAKIVQIYSITEEGNKYLKYFEEQRFTLCLKLRNCGIIFKNMF